MTTQRLILIAALAATAWSAHAQPNDNPDMVPGNEAYYLHHPWERYAGPFDNRWYQQRAQDYLRNAIRGAGPGRDLRIGDRVARDLLNRQYAIDNLPAHKLFTPPPGYRWYQAGADYVLVETATGRIANTRYGR